MQKNNTDQKQYDKWWTDFVSTNIEDPGTAYRANLIIKKINKLDVKNIADVGCGSGELLRKIMVHTKDKRLTGYDVSQKIIEINRKKYPNVDFSCLNLNEDSTNENKFDLVICCEVIEHLRNWKKSIKTLSELPKKGGYVIITTQSGKIYNHHKALDHLRHFKKEEIEKELRNNGVKIIESYYSGWPYMNLKNLLAHFFFKNIENSLLKSEKQGPLNKFAFKTFSFLYSISSMSHGPQIFILGKKYQWLSAF